MFNDFGHRWWKVNLNFWSQRKKARLLNWSEIEIITTEEQRSKNMIFDVTQIQRLELHEKTEIFDWKYPTFLTVMKIYKFQMNSMQKKSYYYNDIRKFAVLKFMLFSFQVSGSFGTTSSNLNWKIKASKPEKVKILKI